MSATVDPECSGLGEHVPATPQKVPRTCVRTEVPPTAPSYYCSWGKWPFLLLYSQVPGFIVVKNPPSSAGNAEDTGSAPGLGRSPGEGNGHPLQYSCLGNPMDRGALWGHKRVGHDLVIKQQ